MLLENDSGKNRLSSVNTLRYLYLGQIHYEQEKSENFGLSLTNPQLVGKCVKILIPVNLV
jgi:hypothetical protein